MTLSCRTIMDATGPPVDPDQSTKDPSRGHPEVERVADYFRENVKFVTPSPDRIEPCMYTYVAYLLR